MVRSREFLTLVLAGLMFVAGAQAHAGLLGLWQFNEGSGSATADTSGWGNPNAVLQNDGGSPNPAWVAGHSGASGDYALEFGSGSSNNRVSASIANAVSGTATMHQTTYAAWVYNAGASTYGRVLDGSSLFYLCPGNNRVGAALPNTSLGDHANQGPVVPQDSNWHHIAVVLEPTSATTGTRTYYLDGTPTVFTDYLTSSGSSGSTLNDRSTTLNQTFLVGNRSDWGRDFEGKIDDLAVFNQALTPTQVQDIMNNDFSAFVVDTSFALNKNLLVNGSAELDPGDFDNNRDLRVSGWVDNDWTAPVLYSNKGGESWAPTSNLVDGVHTADGGNNLFTGGRNGGDTEMTQTIDIAHLGSEVDRSVIDYDLSAWLGGYSGNNDNASLTARFLDGGGTEIASTTLGPVTPADRGNVTKLLYRDAQGTLPTGTRSIEVELFMDTSPPQYNDAMADNLSLTLDITANDTYTAKMLATNPAVYYRLNEAAGQTVGDTVHNMGTYGSTLDATWGIVGYPNTAPISGATGPQPTDVVNGQPLTGFAAGNLAAQFTGLTTGSSSPADMINLGTPTQLDTPGQTYSTWFKTTDDASWKRMIITDPNFDNDFFLIMDQGRPLLVTKANTPNSARMSDQAFNDGQWHHLVAVRPDADRDKLQLYVDGQQISMQNQDGNWFDGYTSRIGAMGTSSNAWEGTMDEVAIWNRAITPGEAQSLFAPPAVDAVLAKAPDHYYRLGEGDAYTAKPTVADFGTTPVTGQHAGTFGSGNAETGVNGVWLPGFAKGNSALLHNDAAAVDLGPGNDMGADQMTVSMWFKAKDPTYDVGGSYADRLFQNNSSSHPFQVCAFTDSAGADVGLTIANGSDSSHDALLPSGVVDLHDGQWHHVVAVRNSGASVGGLADVSVIVDGVDYTAQLTDSGSTWGNSGSNAWIGARRHPDVGGFAGTSDEVALWLGQALSTAEAQEIYNAARTPASLPEYAQTVLDMQPVAYYRLEEPSGIAAGETVVNWANQGTTSTNVLSDANAAISESSPAGNVPRFNMPGLVLGAKLAGAEVDGLELGNVAARFSSDSGNSATPDTTINLGNNPALLDSEQLTYALLYRTDSGNEFMRMVVSDNEASNDFSLVMDQGRITLLLDNTNDQTSDVWWTGSTVGGYNDGDWHHIVAVRDSDTEARLYVDGMEVDLFMRGGGSWGTSNYPLIGARSDNAWGYVGDMDEIAIWNRALTGAESNRLFQSLVVPEPTSLSLLALGGLALLRRRRKA